MSLVEKLAMPLMKINPPTKATQIIVDYDCGFGNTLFIRGEHGGLSWEKGKALRNLKAHEWLFEIPSSFTECVFKILINDEQFEIGDNHHVTCGKVITVEPHF